MIRPSHRGITRRQPKSSLSIAVLALGLSGCQGLPYDETRNPPGPLLYEVAASARSLILARDITIAADSARTLLQGGRVVSGSEIDRYDPHCDFEVRTLRKQAIVIKAQGFRIKRVVYDEELFSIKGDKTLLASNLGFMGNQYLYTYVTHMYLSSETAPDVLRVSCAHIEESLTGNHLKLIQFQQAVGVYLRLE